VWIKKDKSGFTIIEMLLVVMISSLIAIAAYRIFAVATKANDRVQLRIEAYRAIDTAFYVIEGDLNTMVRYSFSSLSFIGEEHSIQMIIVSNAGLEVVQYFVDDAKGALVRSQQSMMDFISKGRPEPRIRQVIVARNTFRDIQFQFGYLNSVDADKPIWKSQWRQTPLPFLIRVRLDAHQSRKSGDDIFIERTFLIPHGEWGKL
jgi:prepilin-type N-terminal cleavage/methylation domain-containing protein